MDLKFIGMLEVTWLRFMSPMSMMYGKKNLKIFFPQPNDWWEMTFDFFFLQKRPDLLPNAFIRQKAWTID